MNKDQVTTISGLISTIGAAIAVFFPKYNELINQVAAGIAMIAAAVWAYYTNKPDAQKPGT